MIEKKYTEVVDESSTSSKSENKCYQRRSTHVVGGIIILLIALVIILVVVTRKTTDNPSSSIITPELEAAASKLIDLGQDLGENEFVWDRLAEITDTYGPRLSGSQALEDAITHIAEMARNDGLVVEEEFVMVPHWVRGNEYARMLTPRIKNLHMVGIGMSNGTNNTVLTGEIVLVSGFDELETKGNAGEIKGKIVLYTSGTDWNGYNTQFRRQGAIRAQEYGALASLICSVASYSLQSPHTGTSVTASIPAAALSVEDVLQIERMKYRGSNVTVELYMEAHFEPDAMSRNLVVTLPGSEFQDQYVVVGGHIDSWDNAEGAVDDGGGAFLCYEAIRMIHVAGLKPRRSLRAIFFTNEENGAKGGEDYAHRHAHELPNTSIAIESDSGPFHPFALGFSGTDEAYSIMEELATLLKGLGAANVKKGGGGTDIAPMCNTGVPCGGFDTRDMRTVPYKTNPCWDIANDDALQEGKITIPGINSGYFWYHHTTADTIDKIDPLELQLSSAAMAIWAYSIANLDELLPR